MMKLDDIQAATIRDVTEGCAQLMSAHEYFTCGRCWELAEALAELLPEGRIVEIRVSNGAWSMLIHAGLRLGSEVIDVEGLHQIDQWIDRWSSAWEGPEVVYRNRRGELLGFDTGRTRVIARHFAGLVAKATCRAVSGSDPDMKKAA